MKRFVSASLTVVATAMMVTLSFGCGEGIEGDTGSAELAQRQTTDGTCNSIAAGALRTAQKCFRSGECEPGTPECNEARIILGEFFGNQVCAAAAFNDELNGLPSGNPVDNDANSRPGGLKHIGIVICSAILDCGACPDLPQGFCPGFCD